MGQISSNGKRALLFNGFKNVANKIQPSALNPIGEEAELEPSDFIDISRTSPTRRGFKLNKELTLNVGDEHSGSEVEALVFKENDTILWRFSTQTVEVGDLGVFIYHNPNNNDLVGSIKTSTQEGITSSGAEACTTLDGIRGEADNIAVEGEQAVVGQTSVTSANWEYSTAQEQLRFDGSFEIEVDTGVEENISAVLIRRGNTNLWRIPIETLTIPAEGGYIVHFEGTHTLRVGLEDE